MKSRAKRFVASLLIIAALSVAAFAGDSQTVPGDSQTVPGAQTTSSTTTTTSADQSILTWLLSLLTGTK